MIDLDRAARFIDQQGTLVERARLRYLLAHAPPSAPILDELFAGQRADGGWPPFWAPDYSSLDATCFRLSQAEQLGMTSAEPVSRAVRFLVQRQRDDGSWQEEQLVQGLAPPWTRPGDPAAQLYLTANCGYWVSVLLGKVPSADRAARFLEEHLEEEGRLPTFAHAQWLAAGLWYRMDRQAADRVMDYLQRELVPTLPASNLGWLLVTLQVAGVPASHGLIMQATRRLTEEQQPDGRWVSEDGSDRDVHATLESMRAIMSASNP